MASCLDTYFIVVLEDATTSRIIGAATLFIELKFIHQCSKRGHIEDVIVDSRYRGMNFGRLLVDTLVHIGKHMGCYKISLDCSNEKVGFYEKLGFQCKNNIMYIRFDED
ncbi:glucosamine-phosphate N-acetyltransferase [Schistosoma bovis]|uniref:Glucosamine 6-phosphate N-acetyltransferase n=1 Tax=Schistosoma bovis TaxID=6184 RepID=A0A430QQT6_SCHBO|nr:glucosamine-phosphate N-acetyltransferase [Schistosoma bovis]